ncbi:TMEM175 family protein [Streptomyces meridianus]|uniref:TMEM175 family protein n=1 Tax=Streptomyces meridianus TaxID=2938945 RepID=A0ABT0XCR0_9ACTN|nr:TMEM175 family protein [Streptomyces meridianus]MCM2580175.1 TMEM175 family protein [Streptomyces meridianus]
MERGPVLAAEGGGVERLTALSDGVFAIAMTLLVLDLSVPPGLDGPAFRQAMGEALPNLAAYALSFGVIAQLWRDHRRILGSVNEVDTAIVTLTLLGLGLIALLPFPTSVLAEYSAEALAVAVYSGSVALQYLVHLALMITVHRRLGDDTERKSLRARRLDSADLAVTVVVFGLAVPLAFVSPTVAKWFWLVLLPLKVTIGRKGRNVRRGRASGTAE